MNRSTRVACSAKRIFEKIFYLQQKVEKEREIIENKFFLFVFGIMRMKIQDNESFLNLLKMDPRVIENRVNFFERLLSDENGHLYTIQEDDFFSILLCRNKQDLVIPR